MSMSDDVDKIRIEAFLDDDPEPIVTHRPPVRFQLDTTELSDGAHTLRIRSYDSAGHPGERCIRFTVRNGPGISVNGINDEDVLEGKVPILLNSYGGSEEEGHWEPGRVETPAPPPTWIWVLFLVIVAFAVFYGVRQWNPPPEMMNTPTYGQGASDSLTLDAEAAHVLFPKIIDGRQPPQTMAIRTPQTSRGAAITV